MIVGGRVIPSNNALLYGIIRIIIHDNYHTFALFDHLQNGNLMTPVAGRADRKPQGGSSKSLPKKGS